MSSDKIGISTHDSLESSVIPSVLFLWFWQQFTKRFVEDKKFREEMRKRLGEFRKKRWTKWMFKNPVTTDYWEKVERVIWDISDDNIRQIRETQTSFDWFPSSASKGNNAKKKDSFENARQLGLDGWSVWRGLRTTREKRDEWKYERSDSLGNFKTFERNEQTMVAEHFRLFREPTKSRDNWGTQHVDERFWKWIEKR